MRSKASCYRQYGKLIPLVNYNDLPTMLKTKTALVNFWADVKELRWPEYYGASPWSLASQVAYIVCNNIRVDPTRGDLYETVKFYRDQSRSCVADVIERYVSDVRQPGTAGRTATVRKQS